MRKAFLAAGLILGGCSTNEFTSPGCPSPSTATGANYAGLPPVVWDDGKSTFLRFPGNQLIPDITAKRLGGKEQDAATTVDPITKVVTVHGVYPILILRDGSRVACIINNHYDQVGRS